MRTVTTVELSAFERITPLGSGYLEAYASTDPVVSAEYRFDKYTTSITTPFDDIAAEVLARDSDVFAFSAYVWNVGLVRQLAKLVREHKPNARVMLGGPGVRYHAERYLDPADEKTALCNGEGEVTFTEYLRALTEPEPDLSTVAGISFYREGERVTTLGAAPLATETELAAIDGWNATTADYPRDRTVVDLFADHVAATPDAPALTYGDTRLTYRELDRVSTALANELRDRGVRAEDTVGLLVDRDPTVVVAMLAVAKAGGAYVPLDPAHPRHRLRQIVAESDPVVLLGDAPADMGVPVVGIRTHLARTEDATLDGVPATAHQADGLLYVLYTSGSTGTPKGVAITHRNVLRLVTGTSHFTFRPGDRVAQISNAAFDAATLEIWGALCTGGHLIGFDRRTVLDPAALATALRRADLHTVVLATPLFTQLVGHDPETFATVRQLLVGGDSMDPKRAAEVAALGGPLLSNGYGPTESTTFATIQPLPAVAPDAGRLPIGSPIANTTVYVLDERLRPVPVGVPGELYIGGDGLGRGYLGRPDLTADRFRPDPFAGPSARMYATGDRARWLPDGTIDFLGRTDHQVKIRGFRVELGDVDAALRAHPYVLEAVTVVDTSTGDKRLAGYYAGRVDPKTLTKHLAERLPEYMVPAVLVPLDALPKNPNGKLDRDKLPAATAPVEAPVATGRAGEIAAVLAELLGQPAIDPADNFFDIGGHSLLAIRLLTRIREHYGVDMPLGDLFDNPTASAIAEYVDANTETTAVPSGPVALPRRAAR